MARFGPEHVAAIREALTTLYGGVGRPRGPDHGPPVRGSPFANELSQSARNESLVSARSIARMLIEFGREHMTAFVKTTTAREYSIWRLSISATG